MENTKKEETEVRNLKTASDERYGTHLIILTSVTMKQVRERLGEPIISNPLGDCKVTMEWNVKVGKDVLTVYDYKGSEYVHIGGKGVNAEKNAKILNDFLNKDN